MPAAATDLGSAAATGMVLAFHAAHSPDRMAIISADGDRTFAELNANANRLARALRARGIGAGDSVALVCSNRPEFAEAVAATNRIGVRMTTVNWHLTGDEMGYITDNSDAKAVIGDARFADALTTAMAMSPNATVRLAVGGSIDGFDDYDAAIAAFDGDDIDDAVLGRTMLYTSGTTGRPKGVDRPPAGSPASPSSRSDLPDAGVALAVAVGTAARQNGQTDRHLCTGPLYHAAPLAFSLAGPLGSGCGVVLMDGWTADETLRLVSEHGVTHTHMVATMFHRLLAVPAEVRESYDLSSLRFVIHGAAPCPVSVKRGLIDWLGPVVYEYYAATEGGGTFVGPEEWLTKPGTVGRPFHPELLKIFDGDGNTLEPNEIGTVYMRAPAARFHYYKDEAKTSSSYIGEFFTLGDHGYLDDDGFLFLTGRSAELIISGGVNIYPAEIDAVLLGHPDIADAGTIGIPNDEWGEEVKAVVELKPGIEPTPALAAQIREWCRPKLASYKLPRSIDFVETLPRHDNGKLYRGKLRELYVTNDDPTGHRTAT